ncbi:CoA transferase [Terriglobus albidus]|uniref:CoA transferase n=1 Tax=Terriglobus albidus TaxID=1592106 RepID=A0A5B9EEP4_9BACT|nr:CoA transferase [Terriglobus albidus]QEE28891.1 CoA transferase [Terriglobus albidus]
MSVQTIFSGLKVVDLASFIAGPAAATVLSDFGAEVIKVEPPGFGDPYRIFPRTPPNPSSDINYSWQLTNRNKRGIALDLKNPEAREVLETMIKWADVFITNYPPRVRASLGLTYEDVSPLNDRLIYADITGYGDFGPRADEPGYDVTAYWARSGLMAMTRDAGGDPTLPIPGIGDHATAISLYSAIVTALYQRERTGKGTRVTTSLIAEGAWAAATWIEGALNNAKFFGLHDRKNPPNALFNPYPTSDGRWLLLLIAQQDRDWPALVNAIGRPELLGDARFSDVKSRSANASALATALNQAFSSKSLAEWKQIFEATRITVGVVQNLDEVVHDEQMLANKIIVPVEGTDKPVSTVNSPMQVIGAEKVTPRRAPGVGEHTREVLLGLGFSEEKVEALRLSGAAPQAPHADAPAPSHAPGKPI